VLGAIFRQEEAHQFSKAAPVEIYKPILPQDLLAKLETSAQTTDLTRNGTCYMREEGPHGC